MKYNFTQRDLKKEVNRKTVEALMDIDNHAGRIGGKFVVELTFLYEIRLRQNMAGEHIKFKPISPRVGIDIVNIDNELITLDANTQEKLCKKLNAFITVRLKKLYDDIVFDLKDGGEYLNYIYVINGDFTSVGSERVEIIYFKRDNELLLLTDHYDYKLNILRERQVRKRYTTAIISLYNMKEMYKKDNKKLIPEGSILDANDTLDGYSSNVNAYILKKEDDRLYMIADFDDLLDAGEVSAISRLITISDNYSCLNNRLTSKKSTKMDIFYELNRFLLKGTGHAWMDKYERSVLFDVEYCEVHVCPFAKTNIFINKYIDIFKYDAELRKKYIYIEKYGWCDAVEYRTQMIAEKIKAKKHVINFYEVYDFGNEENIKNFKALNSTELRDAQTKILGYGTPLSNMCYLNEDNNLSQQSNQLYMGVELEFDRGGHINNHNSIFLAALNRYKPYAWSTRDGSLKDGFETKTVPAVLSKHMDINYFDYRKAFKVLKRLDYIAGDSTTCGLHVHVPVRYFMHNISPNTFKQSSEFIKHLGLVILSAILERNWADFLVFTRRSDDELARWARNHKIYDNFQIDKIRTSKYGIDKTTETIYRLFATYAGKYSAVSNNKKNTYEFRLFKGTLNYTTYIASLQLVDNICKLAKEMIDNSIKDGVVDLDYIADNIVTVDFNKIVNYHQYDILNNYVNNLEKYKKDAEDSDEEEI